MKSITESYFDHFTPLVQKFLTEMDEIELPSIKNIPEPFLPAFGSRFEQSALRLILIGQDTRGWGDMHDFLGVERSNPGRRLRDNIDEFHSKSFTNWGARRQSFWGFAMMFLAALHGQEDWEAMKQGEMTQILDSFAWGNGNAIEIYSDRLNGVSRECWEKVRRAGNEFNRFSHVVETLKPHVAVIMYRGIDLKSYFKGYRYELVTSEGRINHYRLTEKNIDVFHVPHPGSMNRIEGTDYFRDKLRDLFVSHGLSAFFPEFLENHEQGKKSMEYLSQNAPKYEKNSDKYIFVTWVASELRKRDTFMSVPALCNLLNQKGYRTNYGTEYLGGRGSYKLLSGTYWRLKNAGNHTDAENVALAFRRPNFEYAYSRE
jgi:hypothetical protein